MPKNLLVSGNLLSNTARKPLKRYRWHWFLNLKYKYKVRVFGFLSGDVKDHYFSFLREVTLNYFGLNVMNSWLLVAWRLLLEICTVWRKLLEGFRINSLQALNAIVSFIQFNQLQLTRHAFCANSLPYITNQSQVIFSSLAKFNFSLVLIFINFLK